MAGGIPEVFLLEIFFQGVGEVYASLVGETY
jgi:hypothetical protein